MNYEKHESSVTSIQSRRPRHCLSHYANRLVQGVEDEPSVRVNASVDVDVSLLVDNNWVFCGYHGGPGGGARDVPDSQSLKGHKRCISRLNDER